MKDAKFLAYIGDGVDTMREAVPEWTLTNRAVWTNDDGASQVTLTFDVPEVTVTPDPKREELAAAIERMEAEAKPRDFKFADLPNDVLLDCVNRRLLEDATWTDLVEACVPLPRKAGDPGQLKRVVCQFAMDKLGYSQEQVNEYLKRTGRHKVTDY